MPLLWPMADCLGSEHMASEAGCDHFRKKILNGEIHQRLCVPR